MADVKDQNLTSGDTFLPDTDFVPDMDLDIDPDTEFCMRHIV